MKTPRFLPLLLLLAAVFSGLAPQSAHAKVSFNYFYESLDPLGDWIQVPEYGYCWRPSGVDPDWAPYTDGYWTYTDAGWTWVSYEDFGNITYHYGRWVNLEDEGWSWVPDNQWGPAWVSWRKSNDYVGWAPLPPEAHFTASVGISDWADTSYDIGPSNYNFCRVHDFGAPVIRQVIVPRGTNVTFIRNTVNITNITYNNSHRVVYNGGPQYAFIAERSYQRPPTLKLVQNTTIINNTVNNTTVINNFNNGGGRRGDGLQRAVQQGNTLQVYAPEIEAPVDRAALRPARVTKVIAVDKVNRGWKNLNEPGEREALKASFQQQTGGRNPQNAHARPVAPAELQVVPQKVDLTAKPVAQRPGRPGKPGTQPAEVPATDDTAPGQTTPMPPVVGKPGQRPGRPGKPGTAPAEVPATAETAPGQTTPVPPVVGKPGQRPGKPGTAPAEVPATAETAPGQTTPVAPVVGKPGQRPGRPGSDAARPDLKPFSPQPPVNEAGTPAAQPTTPPVEAPVRPGGKPGRGKEGAVPAPERARPGVDPAAAAAAREQAESQQAARKAERAAADARTREQSAAAQEATRQKHDEQVQARQAAVERQQTERAAAAEERKARAAAPVERPAQPRPQAPVERPQAQPERPRPDAGAAAAAAQQQRQAQMERASQAQAQQREAQSARAAQAQQSQQQAQQRQAQTERASQAQAQQAQQRQVQQREAQSPRVQPPQQRPAPQQQPRVAPQPQAPPQQPGGNGRGGKGKALTPEEAAALRQQSGR